MDFEGRGVSTVGPPIAAEVLKLSAKRSLPVACGTNTSWPCGLEVRLQQGAKPWMAKSISHWLLAE
jgi:hypothetical protein